MKAVKFLVPLLMCIIGAGLFPIINFNPNNPVDLGLVFRIIIIAIAFTSCVELGKFESIIFPKWNIIIITIFNFSLGCIGLIFRYLLEFGEVSNTYNFTFKNIVFHLAFITIISTLNMPTKNKT